MADTLANMSLIIGFTAVMAAAILFMVNIVRESDLKRDKSMESHSLHHARHMTVFGNKDEAKIMYILPKERNLWEKITRRVGIWAWKCSFSDGDITFCRFYKPISTSAYFYMQLKGWTETPDKESAEKAMDYMKWDREIP